MDYEFMKMINAHQIQKEIDDRMAQDAIRQKQGVIINIQAERGSLQKKQTVIIQEGKNNFV